MTLGIARTTEPLPTRTSEQSLEKRTFEVVVTNELRYASAREMNVITAIPLTSCRRLAGGDDDLGGRDTAADETETRAERVRCSLPPDVSRIYRRGVEPAGPCAIYTRSPLWG
jgi:hypothetical protein